MMKYAALVAALVGCANYADAGAAFTQSKPTVLTTCNRIGHTNKRCDHKSNPGHPGGTPSQKMYGDWIRANDKPITLKVEGGAGKRFLEIPVSMVSTIATMTNSSSSHTPTTEAEAKVEAMVKVTLNQGGYNEHALNVYPPKVTMLERDQKLTVTADNLACLVEMEDEWVTCSNASDEDCECGVDVALAVEETVATTFLFYAHPIDMSSIATIELYYRLSGYINAPDNTAGEIPDNTGFTAGVVYNTMSATLLQMPAWEREGEIATLSLETRKPRF